MKLSIVTTLFKSSVYIEEFYHKAKSSAKKVAGERHEIIFVNDGSPDNSLEIAKRIADKDEKVIVVDLSRNFGHHEAMMTAISQASGDLIFLIDSDLEENPELLISFERILVNENLDVVYGVQKNRKNTNFFMSLANKSYYYLFRLLTKIHQPDNIMTVRLMTKRYAKALLMHDEREINISGLFLITGFNQKPQEVEKPLSSPSSYSLLEKINMFVNSLISFTSIPLNFIFYIGILIFCSSIIYILFVFTRYFTGSPLAGFSSVIISIWMFSGLIILFIGLQGIYIAKIFLEVKRRPRTIIKEVYKKNG